MPPLATNFPHLSLCVCAVTGDVATDPGVFSLLQLRHQRHRVLLPAGQQRLAAPPAAGRPEALAGPGTRPQEGQGQSSEKRAAAL